ncbi:MAG: anthranilate synthase component II [Thermoplasmataceae archaeon]
MKVLLVNNHDSFVYNIYQSLLKITDDVDVQFNDNIDISGVGKYERIIISPGPGNPVNERDAGNLQLLMDSIGKDAKVLGICFGHQFLAFHLGSRVVLSKRLMHGQIDRLRHSHSPIYRNVPEHFTAIRYHSLAIEPGENIVVDCISDSDGTIMGFHSKNGRFFGVQFHPESYYSEYGETIFTNFLGDAF